MSGGYTNQWNVFASSIPTVPNRSHNIDWEDNTLECTININMFNLTHYITISRKESNVW